MQVVVVYRLLCHRCRHTKRGGTSEGVSTGLHQLAIKKDQEIAIKKDYSLGHIHVEMAQWNTLIRHAQFYVIPSPPPSEIHSVCEDFAPNKYIYIYIYIYIDRLLYKAHCRSSFLPS